MLEISSEIIRSDKLHTGESIFFDPVFKEMKKYL